MPDTSPSPGWQAPASPEFYVGYLPTPPGLHRFVFRVAAVVLLGVVAAAIVIAGSQGDPGPAVWSDGKPRPFKGIISSRPYPMLYADDRGDGRPGLALLVEPGKHGAARAAAFDGKRVVVSGTALTRDAALIIELDEEENAIGPDDGESSPIPSVRSTGRVTLRGEIIDPKCFLGAMKPGEGKTHKECATLCISGGIPPMFATKDPAGSVTCYLLLDPGGGPLDPAAYCFIADQVELTGDAESQGDLLRLRVRAADIHRR